MYSNAYTAGINLEKQVGHLNHAGLLKMNVDVRMRGSNEKHTRV